MSYLAFALKYRPQSFAEVVGQSHVVTSLQNAISKERVHHAYIFSGPRGVGKTSLARILAKSLNCEKGPTIKPCGVCPSCQEIVKGRSLDIIEIDGASNRGIDEIRTLRENVKLSPAGSRFKIYVIDEVHMLTQEAFNALLKTLEEPPRHVKFIFATTHPHKIIPTILSRCQKFQFNLLALEEIVLKLKKIVSAEKIKISENILYTIGRASGGSIRDAESLLDQLVPIILEKKSLDDIFSFLGVIDEDSLNKILKSLVDKDLSSCLDFVEKTVKDGKDLGIFLNAFIEHLRNLLLAKVSQRSFKELSDVSPQSKEFILKLTKDISSSDILKVIDLLLEAKDLSRRLNTVRIPLELALIKYTHKDVEGTIPIKPQAKKPNQPKKIKEKPVVSNKTNQDLDSEIDDLDFGDQITAPPKVAPESDKKKTSSKPSQIDNLLLPMIKTKWKALITSLQKTRAALASHLSFSEPVSSRGDLVAVAFSPQDYFHKEIVESSKNQQFIEKVISRSLDKKVGVKFVTQELPNRPNPVQENAASQETKVSTLDSDKIKERAGEDDGFINELLDTFGGKFHTDDQ
jgi:DNA polymerase-3 subunit gamma/tau